MKLSEASQLYIARKRAVGYKYARVEAVLKQLKNCIGDVELDELSPNHLLSCLNHSVVCPATWVDKYWVLRRFFEDCCARGLTPEMEVPPPKVRNRRDFIPHIFTQAEIKDLLEATKRHKRTNYSLDQATVRAIILTLYATGLPTGELATLLEKDVDLIDGSIRIRSAYANRDRVIPIGVDLREILRQYVRTKPSSASDKDFLFLDRKGKPTTSSRISRYFVGLRRDSKVYRRDNCSHQPRVSDLRFTFAVHRIVEAIERGLDLNRFLPALAAYMGQVGLGSTARYMALTPDRFARDLKKLGVVQRKPEWNQDPALMAFLMQL